MQHISNFSGLVVLDLLTSHYQEFCLPIPSSDNLSLHIGLRFHAFKIYVIKFIDINI